MGRTSDGQGPADADRYDRTLADAVQLRHGARHGHGGGFHLAGRRPLVDVDQPIQFKKYLFNK